MFEAEREIPDEEVIDGIDRLNSVVARAQREMFVWIVEADRRFVWKERGARDMAHWLSIRYGISSWKALRWLAAAHALEGLPRLSGAFSNGELGIDKVVELARFATPETEADLIGWAEQVSCGAIRRRAELASTIEPEGAREAERARYLHWWYTDDGRRLGLEAELPAAQGCGRGWCHPPHGRAAPCPTRRDGALPRTCPQGRCPGGPLLGTRG